MGTDICTGCPIASDYAGGMLRANPSLSSPIAVRPTAAFAQALAALLQFHGRESEKLTTAELCGGANVSAQFVRQLLTAATRAGILVSLQGKQGGYRLAKPLRKITVLDVLQAIDGPVGLDYEDLPTALNPGRVRTIRLVLDGVAGDVATRLGAVTLAELAPT